MLLDKELTKCQLHHCRAVWKLEKRDLVVDVKVPLAVTVGEVVNVTVLVTVGEVVPVPVGVGVGVTVGVGE